MSDNKVTLDQLDNSAVEAMSSSVGDVSMLNTENKTIVGAISEIVGKKEIANAIGEPLAETDKFTEMSSEINVLLNTFKTNMMNAGVVVESGDKFKSLIDKIQGLTEGEGNKGVQFAEGVCDNITIEVNTATNWTEYIFEQDFGFIPSRIMFQSESTRFFALERDTRIVIDSHYHYSEDNCWYMIAYNSAQGLDSYRMYISNISSTGFSLFIKTDSRCFFNSNTWYAIGVGEQSSGSEGLDIISATELPESGEENQLCVITDNITNKFIVSSSWDDVNSTEGSIIVKLGNSSENVITVGEGIQTIYRVDGIYQGDVENALNSYLYKNGSWVEFSEAVLYILKDGDYVIDNKLTEKTAYVYYVNGAGVVYDIAVGIETSDYAYSTLPNMVDVTNLNSINISWIKDTVFEDDTYDIYVYLCPTDKGAGTSSITSGYTYADSFSFTTEEGSDSIDLSSYTGEYYITILHKHYNSKSYSRNTSLTITDLYFK